MIKTDICVIGAGPAGLAASIEAAKCGADVTLIDENHRAGGQLFKQIHKFFGSKDHSAGVRGYDIGQKLVNEARSLGVRVHLRTVAYGIFEEGIGINDLDREQSGIVEAKKIILATGALEKALTFQGWTKPGVIGAGAAQTLMNLYRLRPGQKVVMVGTGNVGLIVSYQLLQAGVKIVAVVEAADHVTGYQVHARKLLRAGVPIYTSTTVEEALGEEQVKKVKLTALAENYKPVKTGKEILEADAVCIAVGLSPLIELARLAECDLKYACALGGFVPKHDRNMRTSKDNVYIAGDITGIEEASSALEEGRIAGIAAAASLGYIGPDEANRRKEECLKRLLELRQGPFGSVIQKAKEELLNTEADVTLSESGSGEWLIPNN